MYEYLEGALQTTVPEAAILDVGGIGFRILVTKTDPCRLTRPGQRVKLFIELVVREDSLTLYGFSATSDRDFFRLLQQVSGIGPKLALNILGHAPYTELAEGIFRKDLRSLTSIPGIGKKLAERLVLELSERVGDLISAGLMSVAPKTMLAREAFRALETLGFSNAEARNAVTLAQNENLTIKTVEELVQYALKSRK